MGLLQHRGLRAGALGKSGDQAKGGDLGLQGDPTAVVDQREAVLLDQGQHAADLPGAVLLAALLDQLAEHTDVLARVMGTPEQLLELRRRARAAVLLVDPEAARLGTQVLAQ